MKPIKSIILFFILNTQQVFPDKHPIFIGGEPGPKIILNNTKTEIRRAKTKGELRIYSPSKSFYVECNLKDKFPLKGIHVGEKEKKLLMLNPVFLSGIKSVRWLDENNLELITKDVKVTGYIKSSWNVIVKFEVGGNVKIVSAIGMNELKAKGVSP